MVANPRSNPPSPRLRGGNKGSAFSFERKVGILLVFILGFGGVILGIRYVGAGLERPFYDILYYDGPAYLTYEQRQEQAMQELKITDTDEDGISDYDELYVYKTSAYLADSDSDGIDDQVEILTGEDPNCPTGRDCGYFFATAEAVDTDEDASEVIENIGTVGGGLDFLSGFETQSDLVTALSSMEPDQIRQALIDFGVPQDTIDNIDDESLMALFNQAVDQSQESGTLDGLVEGE